MTLHPPLLYLWHEWLPERKALPMDVDRLPVFYNTNVLFEIEAEHPTAPQAKMVLPQARLVGDAIGGKHH